MTPGDHGSVGVSSTFHPLSPLLIHMHITLTNSTLNSLSSPQLPLPRPLLSGRWLELLNIYEASGPGALVALMNACLRIGTRNRAKGPPHSSWPLSSQARKKAGRMKGGEAVARRETNGPATQKKEQSSIFAGWSALEWVGMCVRQGSNSPDSQVGNEVSWETKSLPAFSFKPHFLQLESGPLAEGVRIL